MGHVSGEPEKSGGPDGTFCGKRGLVPSGAAWDVITGWQSTMPVKGTEKGRSAARKKSAGRRKAQQSSGAMIATPNTALPAPGTLARTRRLLLAALRLWELRRGIRD